jgi:hypothetical protein
MSTTATVVPLPTAPRTPSRVPMPGVEPVTDTATAAAVRHYSQAGLTLTPREKVAIAHLRGWTHFGPLCPLCGAR